MPTVKILWTATKKWVMIMKTMEIFPAGDRALVVEFGKKIEDETNNKVHALSAYLKERRIKGIRETLPTYRSLMVFYDSSEIDFFKLSKLIRRYRPPQDRDCKQTRKKRIVPCCYGGEYGPDLKEMSNILGMAQEEIIRIHEKADYKIYMLGFLPGFVYLGGLDEKISIPRLDTPRMKIPARSVGIGGSQTGVYPISSPGGWRLIGRTPFDFYNPENKDPILCKAGEYISFVSIKEAEYDAIRKDIKAGVFRPEYA